LNLLKDLTIVRHGLFNFGYLARGHWYTVSNNVYYNNVFLCPDGCGSDVSETSQQKQSQQQTSGIVVEHYRLGFQECLAETMHFLVEDEGCYANDPLCVQLINHLQAHCDKITKGIQRGDMFYRFLIRTHKLNNK
jgi:hypothetical protein